MDDLIKVKDFFIGMLLSAASWEVWQNVFVSLTIAFLGGFLAAAGKGFFTWCNKKRKNKKDNTP